MGIASAEEEERKANKQREPVKQPKPEDEQEPKECDLFHDMYTQVVDGGQRLSWMKYKTFRKQWNLIHEGRTEGKPTDKEGLEHLHRLQSITTFSSTWKDWLVSKLVFDHEEAHNSGQTSEG